jgi:hypothetical protein
VKTSEAPELNGERAGGVRIPVERRARRRDRFEAVGLLLGILGVLLVVAVTVGPAAPT